MSAYVWIKLIHISAIAVWSAGLLYLPALFAEHARVLNAIEFRRVRRMTRLVFVGLISPAAVIAVVSGTALIPLAASLGGWLVIKLGVVAAMVMLHVYCGRLLGRLYSEPRMRRPAFHLLLMLPAAMLIISIVYLVTAKPA